MDERIFSLKAKDERGLALPLEIRGGGLFLINTQRRQISIDYEARLARVLDPSQYALTSSQGPEAAVLMLGDLLPRLCVDEDGDCRTNSARVQIKAPPGWKIATTEKTIGAFYEIDDPQHAVFFLGNFRERLTRAKAMNIRIVVTGAWSFSDEELFRLAEAIARQQAELVDSREEGDCLITLLPFPLPLTGLRSSGVTVRRTVVLQLNANNNPAHTFAHLQRHLAHEMFHLYLPNAFRIRENFDWFWEGFTRYIALLTLTRLQIIGPGEYLDSIGSEYEAYAYNPLRTQVSLLAASPEKFTNNASYDIVYRKGMLVAALYDMELRWQSRGKYGLADLVRELYQKYAIRGLEIGNSEVLKELNGAGDFKRMIRDDIEGTKEIDIVERIKPYGLTIEWSPATGGKVMIRKAAKLSLRQQQLFDQLTINK